MNQRTSVTINQLLDSFTKFINNIYASDVNLNQVQSEWNIFKNLLAADKLDYEYIFEYLTRLQFDKEDNKNDKSDSVKKNIGLRIDTDHNPITKVNGIAEMAIKTTKNNTMKVRERSEESRSISTGRERNPLIFNQHKTQKQQYDVSGMMESLRNLRSMLNQDSRELIKMGTTTSIEPQRMETRTPLRKIKVYANPNNQQNVYNTIEKVVSDSIIKQKEDMNTQTLWYIQLDDRLFFEATIILLILIPIIILLLISIRKVV